MKKYNLRELLYPWISKAPIGILKNITLDSRKVKKGDLFLAVVGNKKDGRNYIPTAIINGVSAVIAEAEGKFCNGDIYELYGVPIIYLNKLNQHLSAIAGRFYSNPSRSLRLVGVTGTNGKTTTSHLLAQWTKLLGEISTIMGSIGNGILGDTIYKSNNTTESAIEIQRLLALFNKSRSKFCAMELSSHGLIQHRANDLHFSAAVFTNLSRDHLDYHRNISNYEKAKFILFNELSVEQRIINIDDPIGKKWIYRLPHSIAVTTNYANLPNNWKGDWLCAEKKHYHYNGTDIYFESSWGKGLIYSPLIGELNVNNFLLAFVTLLVLGYPISSLLKSSYKLKSILGRMEVFNIIGRPIVIVDYAHTPDALKKVLISSRRYCKGKLWCIFGCGGERDKGKRPIMGAIAEKYADRIIITDDNPRNEESQIIIDQIKIGIFNLNNIKIINNRIEAVTYAIMHASPEDLVLVSGKGDENYQIIGNKFIIYSDRCLIKKILGILE